MTEFLGGVYGGDRDAAERLATAVRERTGDRVHVHGDGDAVLLSSRPDIDQGDVAVAFNGNLLDLAGAGSAEERVASLYRMDGIDFPGRIDGRFRAAVYDRAADRLVLASDKIGSKFIYHTTDRPFTFCSELSPLLALPRLDAELDTDAAVQHVRSTMQLFGGGPTLIDGVRKTYSAERTVVTDRAVNRATYWDVDRHGTRDVSDRDAVDRVEELLVEAVDRMVDVHDGPVPVMFSGGLDSTMLVSLLRERAPDRDIHTYTFSWSDTGLDRAARMAERYDAEPHTFRRDYRLPGPRDMWLYEEPASIPDLPTRQLARSEEVDTLFTGFPAVIPFPVGFGRVRRLDRTRWLRPAARLLHGTRLPWLLARRFPGVASGLDTLASPYASSVMTNAMQVPGRVADRVVAAEHRDVPPAEARIDQQWGLDGETFEETFHYLHLRMYDGPFTGLMFNDMDNHEVYGYPPLVEYTASLPMAQVRGRRLLKRLARHRVPDHLVTGGPSGIGFVTDNILLPCIREDRDVYEAAVGRLASRDLFDAGRLRDVLRPGRYADLPVGRVLYMQRMYEFERWMETFLQRDEPWREP